MDKIELASLPKEILIEIIQTYSQNTLTIDGLWFLGMEERYGIEKAIETDISVWRRYGSIEARRIKRILNIKDDGVSALAKALNLQIWAQSKGMQYDIVRSAGNKVVFNVTDCSVQRARMRDNRPLFECKPVGVALFEEFAKEINPKFKMNCLVCPPDDHPDDLWCSWEFELQE
ncbi:MAG: DUF6125 family protein [Chloroflexota bacterium]|nr:DUF6125 family protein [Chloroflexota bacterium]